MRSPWGSPSSRVGLGSVTSDFGGRSDTITQSWPRRKSAAMRGGPSPGVTHPTPTPSSPILSLRKTEGDRETEADNQKHRYTDRDRLIDKMDKQIDRLIDISGTKRQ